MRDIMLEFEDLTYRLLEMDDVKPKKKRKFKKFLKKAGLVGAGALGAAGTLAGIAAMTHPLQGGTSVSVSGPSYN